MRCFGRCLGGAPPEATRGPSGDASDAPASPFPSREPPAPRERPRQTLTAAAIAAREAHEARAANRAGGHADPQLDEDDARFREPWWDAPPDPAAGILSSSRSPYDTDDDAPTFPGDFDRELDHLERAQLAQTLTDQHEYFASRRA